MWIEFFWHIYQMVNLEGRFHKYVCYSHWLPQDISEGFLLAERQYQMADTLSQKES